MVSIAVCSLKMINPSCASFRGPIYIFFVYDEDLKWSIQGYSFCLLACNCSRSGVNVRAHLLRINISRNFKSIRSVPISSQLF